MATSQITPQRAIPLHLSGNITPLQNTQLFEFLSDAIEEAYRTAVGQLDQQAAQTVLGLTKKLKSEVAEQVVGILHRHTVSDKYKNEQVESTCEYPSGYRLRTVEAQVTDLRRLFPTLGSCLEKLARKPLPDGAEGWFVIPRWQALASTYGEAIIRLLDVMATKRKTSNRLAGKVTAQYLRETERSKLAGQILAEQQGGNDLLVVAAQAGRLHRGSSARRTRVALQGNEFGLGAFAIGCILLTHPERLSRGGETLMIDCGGDEYSAVGDYTFDRVPLFDFDMGGIEFSIFYDDRARNIWGTPTGFLYRPS